MASLRLSVVIMALNISATGLGPGLEVRVFTLNTFNQANHYKMLI